MPLDSSDRGNSYVLTMTIVSKRRDSHMEERVEEGVH